MNFVHAGATETKIKKECGPPNGGETALSPPSYMMVRSTTQCLVGSPQRLKHDSSSKLSFAVAVSPCT